MLALGNEARRRAQHVAPGAENRQRRIGTRQQVAHALLGAVDPELGDEGGLAQRRVLAGLLAERCGIAYETMFDAMTGLLAKMFPYARKGMAFNLMSKHVDWEREDLFHVPYDQLSRFVVGHLSRHHVIRADYGLYEYTVYVYKAAA